jgi:hypothetical protein
MKRNEENESLALLDQIERVDAPPFLLTRIQQQVSAVRAAEVSPAMVWSAGLVTVLVLVLNVWVLTGRNTNEPASGITSENFSMFFPKNSIYE